MPKGDPGDIFILEISQTEYQRHGKYRDYGWKIGEKLTMKSKWLSGNGCKVNGKYIKQAYFIGENGHEGIGWEDHVKLDDGQLELQIV